MASKTLAEKLKLKPGSRAALLNAPQAELSMLGHLPKGVQLQTSLDGEFDWILLFARSQKDLAEVFPPAAASLRPDGVLWAAFPKGSSGFQSDLTRDQGWDITDSANLKWVILISVDDEWSAFGFRHYKPNETHSIPDAPP